MNQTKATSSETRRERKEEEMTIVRVLSNTQGNILKGEYIITSMISIFVLLVLI